MSEILATVLSHIPTGAEVLSAIPVILSLIMIEGLLSVDNAMGIAAMASELPKDQQKKALRYGIVGAYALRGFCMFFVAWIAGNMWLKAFGATYLIYLMASGVLEEEAEEERAEGHVAARAAKGLFATIIAIEFMDLSLSLDNVVAAVALDKRLWVVCTGVFIGILALRFVAGYCIALIEKFPILQKTAFLLIGFVGLILLSELCMEPLGIHYEITSVQKFIGIVTITAASLWYERSSTGKYVLGPIVRFGQPMLMVVDAVVGFLVMAPIRAVIRGIKRLFATKAPAKV